MRHIRQRLLEGFQRLARPRRRELLPVVLDRRRIYVLPTRFGLFYAALVLAMLAGALNYNNNPALMLALVLAGTGLASLFAGHRRLSGLRVATVEAAPVAAGTPMPVRWHVEADPESPRDGLLASLPAPVNAPAVPIPMQHGRGLAELPFPTRHRGLVEAPRLRIASTWPLGLARCWADVLPRQSLLVYPSPEPDGPPLPAGDEGQDRGRPQRSGEDMHHLREYRRSDARHAIAWKPSARHASLLVRENEQPQGGELRLDWNSMHGLDAEARIRRLSRWVDEATRQGRRYRLHLPGTIVIGPDSGTAHRHACLRALALLPRADNTAARRSISPAGQGGADG